MAEPGRPFHPSCWAWTRDEWRKARRMSDHPIPGRAMGPNWDPGVEVWMVHTNDGYVTAVPTHHLVVIDAEAGEWPEPPGPPEDWEPGQDEPPAFLR